jgi:aspartate-semialdehyde dehydrogenase
LAPAAGDAGVTGYRVAIVGGGSLLGKELGDALQERRFPALPARLLAGPSGESPAAGRPLIEFGDEPAVLEPFAAEALSDSDVLFFAGSAEETRQAYGQMPERHPLLVDLTGQLAEEPEARLAGLEPTPDEAEGGEQEPELIVTAHPAAQALAHLLDRMAGAGRMLGASAVILEPASQRGWPGIQELQQQTLAAISVQPMPQSVYGAQIAFNLRAELGDEIEPALAQTRRLILRQTLALREAGAETPAPALELLQAPLFHATVLALHVSYAAPVPAVEQVEAALASAWLATPSGGGYPDVLSAAGSDAIQRGAARMDPAGGAWVFATLDNLRRTAFSAVDAAAAVLARRTAGGHERRSRLQ